MSGRIISYVYIYLKKSKRGLQAEDDSDSPLRVLPSACNRAAHLCPRIFTLSPICDTKSAYKVRDCRRVGMEASTWASLTYPDSERVPISRDIAYMLPNSHLIHSCVSNGAAQLCWACGVGLNAPNNDVRSEVCCLPLRTENRRTSGDRSVEQTVFPTSQYELRCRTLGSEDAGTPA